MSYLGDFQLETTFDFKFTTVDNTGLPVTLSGGVLEVYEDNSITQITVAETLTLDFDGVTGLHNCRIAATAANGFGVGQEYQVVVQTGTINSISAVGYVVGSFSIENRSALMPTTNGRRLDVAATGEAGVDLGNVTGVLGNANVGWIDGSNRVDVGSWIGTAVTLSATTTKPEVDINSISDDATAANNAELMFDGTGYTGGTTLLRVDAEQISASATAANDVEANISNLDATVATRATPAQVNTEVSDVLKTDTITLPAAVAPPLAPTFEQLMAHLYKAYRNRKTQTATQWSLLDDAEAVVQQKATVSDDGTTAIVQEIVAGP